MKRTLATSSIALLLLLCATGCTRPQSDDGPVFRTVMDQIDAFNTGDVDRMVENLTETFKWYTITADSLLLEVDGKDAFREGMVSYFNMLGEVSSRIDSYIVDGNVMSFREIVSYTSDDGMLMQTSALAAYHVYDGKIDRAYYFGP